MKESTKIQLLEFLLSNIREDAILAKEYLKGEEKIVAYKFIERIDTINKVIQYIERNF